LTQQPRISWLLLSLHFLFNTSGNRSVTKMSQLPLKEIEAKQPGLRKLKNSIEGNLKEYFEDVKVCLEVCPDLNQKPFNFPAKSISNGAILDVGGPANLTPSPNLSKKYSMDQLLDLCNVLQVPNDILFGACAGPFWKVGKNSEMVACKLSKSQESKSFLGLVNENNSNAEFKTTCSNEFGILGNFFVCGEEPESTVLRITARKRISDENFTNSVRKSIMKDFPEEIISLGGVFSVSQSKLNCHVMPDFSTKPLENDEMVKDWLNFYAFDAPMTFASVLHCHDPGLKLRMEHSHGYNEVNGQLGHYHNDLNPENVIYDGVFALASKVIRIDMPN